MALAFLPMLHFCFDTVSLMDSESYRFAPSFVKRLRSFVLPLIVDCAYPCFSIQKLYSTILPLTSSDSSVAPASPSLSGFTSAKFFTNCPWAIGVAPIWPVKPKLEAVQKGLAKSLSEKRKPQLRHKYR